MPITLKAARVNVGLTQAEAAERIGVSTNTISRWESGASAPTFRYMGKICNVYKLRSYEDIIFLPKNDA